MGNFQVLMSDKKETYIRSILVAAQGKFQLSGEKYSMGKTLVRIMEEWGITNQLIHQTKEEKKAEQNNVDIRGNEEIKEHIHELIKRLEKTPTVGTARRLKTYIGKADPKWRPPANEPETKYIIQKAKEVFLDE